MAGFCEHDNEPLGSIKQDICQQAEGLSAFQIISHTME
jgi:hypothetical protein